VKQLTKHSDEWWEELLRLSTLLMQWNSDRNNEQTQRQVLASMEKLGLTKPINE
jgi:hypothetical protein